jgi:hypothetical protein
MKKNRFIYSLLAAGGLFIATGCGSKLDVAPTQSIDETTALSTSRDVEMSPKERVLKARRSSFVALCILIWYAFMVKHGVTAIMQQTQVFRWF